MEQSLLQQRLQPLNDEEKNVVMKAFNEKDGTKVLVDKFNVKLPQSYFKVLKVSSSFYILENIIFKHC